MIVRQTTKEILAASIMELAKTRSVEKITVKEIVQNCGLTPTTFYHHFQDKYQLLAWIYNRKVEALFVETSGIVTWYQLLLAICTPLPPEVQFYLKFYMRALSEAIKDWFLEGEKMPVEELAAMIDAAMPELLKPYLCDC